MRVPKAVQKPICIIRDDREKMPWDTTYLGEGFAEKVARLKTGDYTIEGMEDIVCIEKKFGWEELASNVGSTVLRQNFIKELRRMQAYPVRVLVVHGELSKLHLLNSRTQHVTPQTISNWVLNITLEYGIQVLPVGPRHKSNHIIAELFKRIYEFNRTGRLYYSYA